MMSGIRGKDTQPEIYIRKGLHARGFRFRIHAKEIPGRPDIVLPKYRALISIRGCFWHGHDCRYFKVPTTRTEFWMAKIEANRSRDRRDLVRQHEQGWRTLIIWECAVRASRKAGPSLDVVALTSDWLKSDSAYAEIDENGMGKG